MGKSSAIKLITCCLKKKTKKGIGKRLVMNNNLSGHETCGNRIKRKGYLTKNKVNIKCVLLVCIAINKFVMVPVAVLDGGCCEPLIQRRCFGGLVFVCASIHANHPQRNIFFFSNRKAESTSYKLRVPETRKSMSSAQVYSPTQKENFILFVKFYINIKSWHI